MTTLVDQLKQTQESQLEQTQGPTLSPATEEPAPRAKRGGTRRPETQARRAARVPFASESGGDIDQADFEHNVSADRIAGAVPFTEEQAQQLRVLWDEYLQKQRELVGPKTQHYRCIAPKPDGTLCGAIVEAGTLEERLKSGEVIRCPHGPHAPEEGVVFDRDRYPQYHHELTPMEPIL